MEVSWAELFWEFDNRADARMGTAPVAMATRTGIDLALLGEHMERRLGLLGPTTRLSR